ncbi:hypothetical protein ACQ4PT_018191 [Festuca glaucescens]
MSSPAWIWNVSYLSVADLDNGVRNLLDGELHLWPAKNWITLLDANGTPIIGKFFHKDEDVLEVGSVVEFSAFHALVDHCILSPQDQAVDPVQVADPKSSDRHWKVSYSTSADLDRGRLKAYDGTLVLVVKDNWLSLRNAKGDVIGKRGTKSKDSFSVGAKVLFPKHVVRMGVPLVVSKNVQVPVLGTGINSNASSFVLPAHSLFHNEQPVMLQEDLNKGDSSDRPNSVKLARDECLEEQSSFANSVHASLFMGLSFYPGLKFAKDVKKNFNVDVHSSFKSGNFLMVVLFGHANFRMDEDLVSIALESVLGGYCGNLKVSLIRDRGFSFCVSSKEVGFHVLKLRKYSCQHFQCYFHLWGRGGPNWKWEFNRWNIQVRHEWTLVSSPKKTMQRGLAALNSKAPQSALAKSQASGKKLQFAETLHYEACLGYQCPDVSVKDNAVHVNISSAAASSQNSKEKGYLSESESIEVLSHEQAQKDFEQMVYKEQMEDDQQEEQESMLINLSDSSASSVNVLDMEIVQQQQQGNVIVNIQSKIIVAPLQGSLFAFLNKSAWNKGMVGNQHNLLQQGSGKTGDYAELVHAEILPDQEYIPMESRDLLLSTPKKKRTRKSAAPVVQLSERRFTRSCLSKEGYRPKHMLAVEPKIKKKSRAKMLLVTRSSSDKEGTQDKKVEGETGETGDHIPVTPLHVMQRVGVALGIAPEKLTKEQLEADPKEAEPVEDTDDQ